eukprot:5232176-Ditylum_brightwellii.AAC.1
MLLSKHPEPTPQPESTFESYEDLPVLTDLDITARTMMQIASQMQGLAGPGLATLVRGGKPQTQGGSDQSNKVFVPSEWGNLAAHDGKVRHC